ncbi:MAG: hypothetical protein K0S32_2365 [Bacteroidetes bacterium]|jgi:hypothetical protein|nr:hypothetical protein [Bacteroidota bacterium]
MNTLYLIIGLFALGALIGIYLLTLVLQKKETPKFVAIIHGAFVIAALILLINYSMNEGPKPVESIVLFIVAALGGLILFIRDMSGKPLPKWLAIGHGLIAVAGFIFLLAFAFVK